jgi:hypothetical protein
VTASAPIYNVKRSVGLLQVALEKASGKPLAKAALHYTK